ncbi:AAA family ATPase [Nocardioides pantholopis]|uniref:AAA family ATPase n=1 Tax=Nocardioides pantholopis TaxID=2483798 RepID=UPI001F49E833|nr:AAA family ATPase [Nocardioides pantholopis]
MPSLPDAPAPPRVLVAGLSGSGKTTLGGRLAALLGVPHLELDALHHGPGWTPRPEFLADVDRLTASGGWVAEWQYAAARPLLAARADLLVWLDLPFPLTLARLVRRTVRRRVRREVLWNGNVEPPLHTIWTDPEHVVRYMVAHRHRYDEIVPVALVTNPGLRLVRLRSPRQVESWLADVSAQQLTTRPDRPRGGS